jgi:phosphatidylserine decarboxylase
MVRDGYLYAIPLMLAGVLLTRLTNAFWAIPAWLLAAFCLWFFRDPERAVPDAPGAIVSPADGKVTDVAVVLAEDVQQLRISIFLNVFNVHVNRSPIAGVVRNVRYQRGRFLNAMAANSADENEQNAVTVEGEGQTVVFKQIAGLIARRIVFSKKIGDTVARGERVGLIKFGSRVDVLMPPEVKLAVKVGDHVVGAASILAYAPSVEDRATSKMQPTVAGAN